ncbi:MAG TPA: polyhydroxyalkanoic acid system family protein [Usitatibacter sp.]|jgi:putative polyhydroxyalkanoate system protein|nr:polyhydroxyalkanoic acid system family protein [Usitatibacter sp.]
MADIRIEREHGLGLAGARAAAERLAADLGKRFGLEGEWRGDVLEFERPGVSGSLSITQTHVRLEVALGFMLKAMKGSIETAVHHEVDKLFPRP